MKLINYGLLATAAALIALVVYVYTAQPALAATDYTCFNQCIAQGHMYGYCQKVCGY